MKINIDIEYKQRFHIKDEVWKWMAEINDSKNINDIELSSPNGKIKLLTYVIQCLSGKATFKSNNSTKPISIKDSIFHGKEITPLDILSNWNYYRHDLNDEETINEYLNNVCWIKPKPNEIYSIKFFRSFTITMPHDNNPEEVLTIIVKFS